MFHNSAITGWGSYDPLQVLSNADLERLVQTSDDWIINRTEIRQRRIAAVGETTSSMCVTAAQRALEKAKLAATDLDLIICATTTPDHLLPSTACLIHRRLGAGRAGAFDLNCACTGYLAALVVGAQFIQARTYKRILVTSGETLSRFIDYSDRNTCVLFGDGAAAVVLEATAEDAGMLGAVLHAHGDVEGLLTIEAGGSALPASVQTVASGQHFVRMRGNELFKFAVRSMTESAREAVKKAGLRLEDIHRVIPHQANGRIVSAVQAALELPNEKVFVNIALHGNTGACSVGISLAEMLEAEPIDPGANLLFVAFGGGLSWGAAVVRWADIAAIRKQREHRN